MRSEVIEDENDDGVKEVRRKKKKAGGGGGGSIKALKESRIKRGKNGEGPERYIGRGALWGALFAQRGTPWAPPRLYIYLQTFWRT